MYNTVYFQEDNNNNKYQEPFQKKAKINKKEEITGFLDEIIKNIFNKTNQTKK